jgi:hypothetical protein
MSHHGRKVFIGAAIEIAIALFIGPGLDNWKLCTKLSYISGRTTVPNSLAYMTGNKNDPIDNRDEPQDIWKRQE